MALSISVKAESFKIDGIFRIARGAKTTADVVIVTLTDGKHKGRGECVPYPRYGESIPSVIAQVEAITPEIEAGLDRQALQTAMPPGAARNALDCAFWDLEAKQKNKRIWDLLDIQAPTGITTAFTISYDTPNVMEAKAREAAGRPLLKIKLASAEDLPRIKAVRRGAPNARIMIDANEGWSPVTYDHMIKGLVACGVEGVEQPLPAANQQALRNLNRPIPIIADESCHTADRLGELVGLYDMINIKLDKTGGLTEALKLKAAANAAGMDIMVGCMVGSSLSMAPAMMLADGAKFIDLDGPLLLDEDRESPIKYDGSIMSLPDRELWG